MTETHPHPTTVAALAARLAENAGRCRHRATVVLAGGDAWAVACASALPAQLQPRHAVWLGAAPPPGFAAVAAGQATRLLGGETDLVVIDAFSGFDPDAFGAASGTLRAGGTLVLLTPPLEVWHRFADPERARLAVAGYGAEAVGGRFLWRFARSLRTAPGVTVIEAGAPCPQAPPPATSAAPTVPAGHLRSADQAAAVEAVKRVIHGQRRRPTVLTADRGRGKSAALGIAAAELLREGLGTIRVTAPRLEAAQTLFEHAGRALPGAEARRGELRLGEARLAFVAPDELIAGCPPADLVLVDEAAAIPAPLLARLLDHYPRLAFATTVHGYEGTGRGFAIRFRQTLERESRGWREVHLHEPIRWAGGDPLEALAFRALLLGADAAPAESVVDAGTDDLRIERADRDALVRDEPTLAQLFGLLVNAHYRTRPLDLRHLLDGPNVTVYLARSRGQVVGTLLAAQEGGFDAATCSAVWLGRRRPHGHLMPETLAAHLGLELAPRQRGLRVIRVAVHASARGRGIGTRLLESLAAAGRTAGLDYLGASFGTDPQLQGFWRRAGFTPVRLSIRRGASSGAHSALVLQGLNDAGARLADSARARFLAQLPQQLGGVLADIEPALLDTLWPVPEEEPGQALTLAGDDWNDLLAFAYGRRVLEAAMGSVWRMAVATLTAGRGAGLPTPGRHALYLRVLQQRGWGECARQLGLPGRAQVDALLRETLRECVERNAPTPVRERARLLAGEQPPS